MKPFPSEYSKQILGAISPDTAHVGLCHYGVNNGATIRSWVETNISLDQRYVTQKRNEANQSWDDPVAGKYHPVVVLLLEAETGQVLPNVISADCTIERIEDFANTYQLDDDQYEYCDWAVTSVRDFRNKRAELQAVVGDGVYISDTKVFDALQIDRRAQHQQMLASKIFKDKKTELQAAAPSGAVSYDAVIFALKNDERKRTCATESWGGPGLGL